MRPIAAAGLVALLLPAAAASALPLGHRGSVLVSGELNPHWSAVTIMPAVTRSTGVGPNVNWMEPDAGGKGSHRQELWSLLMLTQRLYLAASARWFQAPDVGRLMTSARAGVALTPADYDRWQPWLMLEANTMEDL
jgi:hypothetical protein